MQTSLCTRELAPGLITDDQSKALQNLLGEIQGAEENFVIWRTFTEANFSVLNDVNFPTPDSKYHQAIREQLVFYDQLVLLSFDFREKEIDLSEVLEKLNTTAKGYEKQRLEVKRDRLQYEIDGMKRQAKDRIRELQMWSEIKASLTESSEFDTENKDAGELIALTVRYCREALMIDRTNCSDPGAVVNIIAQAATCLKECSRRGIMDQLPPECRAVQKRIAKT